MESYDVLVIILSVALAVFLVMSIISMYLLIKIMRNIRSITEKAEHIAENVDSVSNFFRKTSGPAAIAKLISNIVDSFKEKRKDK